MLKKLLVAIVMVATLGSSLAWAKPSFSSRSFSAPTRTYSPPSAPAKVYRPAEAPRNYGYAAPTVNRYIPSPAPVPMAAAPTRKPMFSTTTKAVVAGAAIGALATHAASAEASTAPQSEAGKLLNTAAQSQKGAELLSSQRNATSDTSSSLSDSPASKSASTINTGSANTSQSTQQTPRDYSPQPQQHNDSGPSFGQFLMWDALLGNHKESTTIINNGGGTTAGTVANPLYGATATQPEAKSDGGSVVFVISLLILLIGGVMIYWTMRTSNIAPDNRAIKRYSVD